MNHDHEYNLFQVNQTFARSVPITVSSMTLKSNNMDYGMYETVKAPSPWDGLRVGLASTSPPDTTSSNSSVMSCGYNRSSDDLSVDSLINNLLQVVNDEKSARDLQLSAVNNFMTLQQNHECTNPHCDICFTRHLNRKNSINGMDQYSNFGNSPAGMSSSPIINLPSASPSKTTSPRSSSISPYCGTHRHTKKLYCRTCSKLVCRDCTEMQHHRDHSTTHLKKAIECASEETNEILEDVKTRINTLTRDIETVQIAAQQLEHNVHKATVDVLACTQRTIAAAQDREKELLNEIEKIRLVKHAVLKLRDDSLRNNIRRLSKVANRLNEAKEPLTFNRNSLELLLATDAVSAELFKIRKSRPPTPQPDDNWISFSGSETIVVTAIANLGAIIANPPGSIGDGRAVKGRGNSPQMIQQHLSPLQHHSPLQQHPFIFAPNPIPLGRPILGSTFSVVVRSGKHSMASPTPSCIIGCEGDMNNESLCRPWGIACDRDGHIIIADRSNNRIVIYSEDGSFLRRFGTHGTGAGQFDRPAGVTVDARRRIIVADKDNHRVQVLTMEGAYLLDFGDKGSRNGQFNYPWDVAANSQCQIAVSDTRNHRVQLFSPDGDFLSKYGFETSPSMWKHFDSPRGVAFTPDGEVVTTDFNNHRIVVIDSDFTNARVIGSYDNNMGVKQFLRPQGLIVDDEGNIIVSDSRNHRIQVLDSSGNLKWKFGSYGKGPDEMDRPSGIALTPSGRIAVVDFGNNRVLVY